MRGRIIESLLKESRLYVGFFTSDSLIPKLRFAGPNRFCRGNQLRAAQSQLNQALTKVRVHEDEYHQMLTLLKQAESRGDDPAISFLQVMNQSSVGEWSGEGGEGDALA